VAVDGVAIAAGVATATNLINLGVPALHTVGRDVSCRGILVAFLSSVRASNRPRQACRPAVRG
jgi:hypothetical protein